MEFKLKNMEDVIEKLGKLDEGRLNAILFRLVELAGNDEPWQVKLGKMMNNICPALPHLVPKPNEGLLVGRIPSEVAEYQRRMNEHTYENSQGGFNYTKENYDKLIKYLCEITAGDSYQDWEDKMWSIFVNQHYCKMENSKAKRPCDEGKCDSCSTDQARKLFSNFIKTGKFRGFL